MPFQLTIVIDDVGQCSVNGPIDNKVIAYGMLEVAKEAIAQHHAQKAQLIQPATLIPFGKPGS